METTEQLLPITKRILESLIEIREVNLRYSDEEDDVNYSPIILELYEDIKTLEESSQKKAKEEERNRIVGILETLQKEENEYCPPYYIETRDQIVATLQVAIERITSDNQ